MYHVPDSVRSTRSEDGGVVLDVEHGKLVRLNATGALIFEWLREGKSESQIAAKVSGEFGVSQDTVQKDVREFIQALQRQHLLRDDGSEILP